MIAVPTRYTWETKSSAIIWLVSTSTAIGTQCTFAVALRACKTRNACRCSVICIIVFEPSSGAPKTIESSNTADGQRLRAPIASLVVNSSNFLVWVEPSSRAILEEKDDEEEKDEEEEEKRRGKHIIRTMVSVYLL